MELSDFKRKAMPVIIRGVKPYKWVWYSNDDDRMHIQAIEGTHSKLPYKIWLETKGKRSFDYAECSKHLKSDDYKRLKAAVKKERDHIEGKWIKIMLRKGWLAVKMNGHIAVVTVYPKSNHKLIRRFDLKKIFPGTYKRGEEIHTEDVGFNSEMLALEVWKKEHEDNRCQIELVGVLWGNKPI